MQGRVLCVFLKRGTICPYCDHYKVEILSEIEDHGKYSAQFTLIQSYS